MDFFDKIVKFNDMYKMESNDTFTDLGDERMKNFKSILSEELDEIDDIKTDNKLERAVQLSDLIGDLIVYCASEARRWGLPIRGILDIIMDSNFSKLGADGKPIYDERGKLLKGPGYYKPEPKIQELLENIGYVQQLNENQAEWNKTRKE